MLIGAAERNSKGFAHGRNRMALTLLIGCDVDQLLDYGCGRASFAIHAAQQLGLTVHACDIDSDLIAQLAERYGADVNFFAVSDSEPEMPLKDGRVSAATCCDVLEHMPEQTRHSVLDEIHRVLADDGVIVVMTPHKGLLSAADPENAKVNFPRIHKFVYTLAKGRSSYEQNYGSNESFGNFSSGAERHVHFSKRELSDLLTAAGFQVEEVRYSRLIYPFIRILLWGAESLVGRVPGADRLTKLCWQIYRWDADLEPGRLGCFVAIRARKQPLGGAPNVQTEGAIAPGRGSGGPSRSPRTWAELRPSHALSNPGESPVARASRPGR
jgi:ubiquinone/menaquinone biosynthesis C-methylase UbiE